MSHSSALIVLGKTIGHAYDRDAQVELELTPHGQSLLGTKKQSLQPMAPEAFAHLGGVDIKNKSEGVRQVNHSRGDTPADRALSIIQTKGYPQDQPDTWHRKESVPDHNSRYSKSALALEYAAMKAMKENGMSVCDALIEDNESGGVSLLVRHAGDQMGKPQSLFQSMAAANQINEPDFKNLSEEDSSIRLLGLVHRSESQMREYAERHCFNTLIGNTDRHGQQEGLVRYLRSDDQFGARLAPAFDISPFEFIHGNKNPVDKNEDALSFMRESGDVIHQFIESRHPQMMERAMEKAQSACLTMNRIIQQELVPRQMIPMMQAQAFVSSYNPISEFKNPCANPEFIEKRFHNNQDLDQSRNPQSSTSMSMD